MIQARKQSTTTYPIVFLMVDSNDHVTGKTGLTPTVTISKNGAAFGAAAGAVSELTSGWYALAGNATDRGTLGSLAVHASATGADPCDALILIVSYDPFVDVATILADYARRTGDYSTAGTEMALTSTAVDAILDEVVEGSLTFRQMLKLFMAVLANKSSGGGTAAIIFRDLADAKARITATVDNSGNRTVVVLDGT